MSQGRIVLLRAPEDLVREVPLESEEAILRPGEQRPDLHVVVVGGGIAGLSAAWRLLGDPELALASPTAPADERLAAGALERVRSRLRVTVVEARSRLGGNIRSQHDGGFVVEWGPNGFLDNAPETPRLCKLLGIENRVVPARDAAARRFLYVRGRLRALPLSAGSFLLSSVLTWRGKLRVLAEPFIPPHPDAGESVFDFAARRIGREAARTLVDAMVSGVYGGDARQLSLISAFPRMYALEAEHGGLVRGMFARMKERREERRRSGKAGEPEAGRKRGARAGPAGPGGVLTSFDGGFQVLIDSLERALLATGRCVISKGVPAITVTSVAGGWKVLLEDETIHRADAVLLSIPSRHAGALVRSIDPDLCSLLQSIPEAPLVVVGLAYALSDLPGPIDGFGFLVPRGEGPRCLGVLWDSSIYPHRAPEGQVLLRAMLGGAHDPEAIKLEDAEILDQVRTDLARTMDLVAGPSLVWILRHPHGIPQYSIGHPERLRRIEERRSAWPGLFLSGNSYRGISVNNCVEESIPIARGILGSLGQTPLLPESPVA